MYTTACDACRQVRVKCARPSQGRDAAETCERCTSLGIECSTQVRRVGRKPGVKNRPKPDRTALDKLHASTGISDHLPNPLQVLAAEAGREPKSRAPSPVLQPADIAWDANQIMERFSAWTDRLGGAEGTEGKSALRGRIEKLVSGATGTASRRTSELGPPFSGRSDAARLDASTEDDAIALQIVSQHDAESLFDGFMRLVTNGSMYLDPSLHSMAYIRSRSSLLFAVILAIASSFKRLCTSPEIHRQLSSLASRLRDQALVQHTKSIEIIQAFLLLASWSEVPSVLARDMNWKYISHSIGLAVELRLDTPLPYCVQMDPAYSQATHDRLVRNAHRICYFLYIHDRNTAMVAGRYPVFPESSLFSKSTLTSWGKHPSAHTYDAPLTASVSLRKLVSEVHVELGRHGATSFEADMKVVEDAMTAWRAKWTAEIKSTHEYDIIARFSTFVLALTLKKRWSLAGKEAQRPAAAVCEDIALEVCCASVHHYKTWPGMLNSATFDTSMVAFCAIYIVQSISRTSATCLSDWDLYRVALLQELVAELESQAEARHQLYPSESMIVVEAMARRLSGALAVVVARRSRPAQPDLLPPAPLSDTVFDWGGGHEASGSFALHQEDQDPTADLFNFSLDGPLHFITDPSANTFLHGFDFAFPTGLPPQSSYTPGF